MFFLTARSYLWIIRLYHGELTHTSDYKQCPEFKGSMTDDRRVELSTAMFIYSLEIESQDHCILLQANYVLCEI